MVKRRRDIVKVDGKKYEVIYYDQKLDGKMKLAKRKKKSKKHRKK